MFKLAISVFNYSHDADTFARDACATLALNGIPADVTPRYASTGGRLEIAALLDVYEGQPLEVFAILRRQFALRCAWLVTDDYAGCVLEHQREEEHDEGSAIPCGIEGISYPFARR